ncbi:cell surface glycoprotein MUC18-like isoform X1 [Mobula birostris]|uniref:cell surface glycoprotein MUC18-like isoform X1 n=2 Tax=Mobula birostris TaxID=1983395 RepID=UPI003B27BA7D
MSSAVKPGRASVSGSFCLTLLTFILPIPGIIATVRVVTPSVEEAEIKKAISIPCVPEISTPDTIRYVQWFVVVKNQRKRIYFQDMDNKVTDPQTDYTDRIRVDENYTLTINPVRVEDEREFLCQVSAGPAGSGENVTKLNVYGAPDVPEIKKIEKTISVSASRPEEVASCVTRNGYPAPNITWYKDRTPLHLTAETKEKMFAIVQSTQEANGLNTISSKLHYLPKKEDKDSMFYCEVSYRMPYGVDKMMESKKIKFSILYPTENVKLLIRPSVVREMDNVTVECQADGSTSVDYTFFREQDGKIEDIQNQPPWITIMHSTIMFTGLTRNDSGVYGCRVLDLETTEEITSNRTLIVNYLDPMVLKPKAPYIFTDGDRNINISCEMEASQQASVVWTKHKKTTVSSGNLLSLPVVTFDDAGNYSCKATIPGVPSLNRQKTISIVVKGPPRVNCTKKVFQRNGPHVNLTCVFKGYPLPRVTCNAEKKPTLKNHRQKNYVVSELILPLTVEQLTLTCSGVNVHGSKAHNFTVQGASVAVSTTGPSTIDISHAKSSGGVVIVVIIVCILLIAILGAVLYFLYKKGKIPCGRSGKQSITQPEAHENIVVEAKNDQKVPEETVLLQGVNGEKKPPNYQGEEGRCRLSE